MGVHQKHYRIDIDQVYKAVTKSQGEKFLRKYYHILTTDHKELYYNKLLDYSVDRYVYHRDHKNNITLPYKDRKQIGEAGSICDCIELLIDQFNYISKTPLDERWRK